MQDSSQLRQDILTARNQQTVADIDIKSLAINERLLALDEVRNRQAIFVYVSFRSEVATLTLVDTLLQLGKTVIVPITRVQEKRLDAIQITDRISDLEPGYCGIPEPTEQLCRTRMVAQKNVETIILPGSVFDERGGRFGYGGGYYDRFLSSVPSASRIGLAFELQIVEKAPLQPHDELLDFVVTEKRVIKGQR